MKNLQILLTSGIVLLFVFCLNSCTSLVPGLFTKRSPHEQYAQKLKAANLLQTAMGKAWTQEAVKSISSAISITLPYKETGFFAAERVQAAAFRFKGTRGETLLITLDKNSATDFRIFTDLLKVQNNNPKLLSSADTLSNRLSYEVKETGTYVLRLQPELLVSGLYTLTITTGPSLSFPVKGVKRSSIQSFFGASRDEGVRKHEGIDIFAPFRTPAIAAANATVSVTTNKLGGKVIFLHPDNKDYTLYYAHLDSQLVKPGSRVITGDTIGLVGKTGNAIHTSPHLHFGVYTFGGAIDPLPFVNPVKNNPLPVRGDTTILGRSSRTKSESSIYTDPDAKTVLKTLHANTIFRIDAATSRWYKSVLPDGTTGFIRYTVAESTEKPIKKVNISTTAELLTEPDTNAIAKDLLKTGEPVNIIGSYGGFYFITSGDKNGWVRNFKL
ncbi:peptidoglycan DD-metalloendopeptidase family protein [Rubrolithibacter danxiaensis]|uniref:peptidoglycan DD-metalloendopeptidase family protein n=1 Tax=Rubrolithibacter danxiaensis TaxID=3390805 RepID=UPI003BF7E175